ncbi:hypothetical protein B0T10DRAFT_467606 [Thelonectria olida]|uniref:Xylanolytic transcriptional activator regulatory domain-containing protein n=1 Tax=Thelonectria olida TaxID=1576542 RepID=A0A9P8VQL2_9HYPO|nr:hypothetical protein B0T10DRAFT_467606 [Thelonectria olida]
MSLWRAGALLQKDTRDLLGAVVSLARTKALHRTPSSQDPSEKMQALRKRLWWSVYIREHQCAAALGLPNRVRDEDCDVETLHEADFNHAFDASTSPSQARESIASIVGMAELSRMLGCITYRDYLPSKHLTHAEKRGNEGSSHFLEDEPACRHAASC